MKNTDLISHGDVEKMKKIEIYLQLSEKLYNQYHHRRALEWKIHISVWTFLALTTYLCVSHDKHLENAFLIFLIIPIHFTWIIKIVKGEIRDQDLSNTYRLIALRILDDCIDSAELQEKYKLSPHIEGKGHSKMPDKLKESFESYWWWLTMVIGTTILLTFGAWSLVK